MPFGRHAAVPELAQNGFQFPCLGVDWQLTYAPQQCLNLRILLHGVTSLMDLGINTSMEEVDTALRSAFEEVFETETVPA